MKRRAVAKIFSVFLPSPFDVMYTIISSRAVTHHLKEVGVFSTEIKTLGG